MSHSSLRQKGKAILLGLGLLWGCGAVLLFPEQAAQAVQNGITLCTNTLIPALFPFFVLSSLTVELGFAQALGRWMEKWMWPLFRLRGTCAPAVVLGLLGGYPVGARTALELYQKGLCCKEEAQRLLVFCNNAGPAFLFGVVGSGVFHSNTIGLLLFLCHAGASLLIGILSRFWAKCPRRASLPSAASHCASAPMAFTKSVKDSFFSVLTVCGFVLFFMVVIRLLFLSGFLSFLSSLSATIFAPLGLTVEWAQRLLTGFLEVTAGVTSLPAEGSLSGRAAMAAFLLGWGGLSVHCQTLAFLADSGLSMAPYFLGKLLQGCLSALFAWGGVTLFHLDGPEATLLSVRNFFPSFPYLSVLLLVSACCILLFLVERKNKSRKKKRHIV